MLRSLPRRIEQVHLSIASLSVLPSPVNRRVGIHDFTFEACSSFTALRPAASLARLKADFCPEASTWPVAQPSRSVASMPTDNYMGGFLLPLVICAVGAHC
jgi:hypothetical protein